MENANYNFEVSVTNKEATGFQLNLSNSNLDIYQYRIYLDDPADDDREVKWGSDKYYSNYAGDNARTSFIITNLKETTSYEVRIEAWDFTDARMYSEKTITVTTT